MAKSSKKMEQKSTLASTMKPTRPLSLKGKALSETLEGFTVEELIVVYNFLVGKKPSFKNKADLCKQTAGLLDFRDQEEFDLFFGGFPKYLQEAIQRGAFEHFIDIRSLHTPVDEPLIIKPKNRYSHWERWTINPAFRLGIFASFSQFEMEMHPFFVQFFSLWVPKPSGHTLEPMIEADGALWSDDQQIAEVIPLLVEASGQLMKTRARSDIARKGLLKGNIKSLRASCALEPFPIASSYGLDPIELFVQALTHLESKSIKRPEDGELYIKSLVQRLFFEPPKTSRGLIGNEIEYYCLLKQFSKTAFTYSVEIKSQGRNGMKDMLQQMHGDGSWFSVDNLFQSYVSNGNGYTFWNRDVLNRVLFMRGDTIEGEYGPYSIGSYDKGFLPQGVLRRKLFEKPLFKAYCYLFAVLGLVEITEKPAALVLSKNGKMHPLTPYEGICSMKVTPFGAWCLGFTDERPKAKKQQFETIADSNLLLVTFKGLSLERRLFLEQIGDAMGSERYKISEVSFIRGCADPSEIRSRIEKFKNLIEPDPSERWLTFFTMVEQRATLFAHGENVLLYTFPDDAAIRKMFAQEPAFRKIILRAEGNRIVIKKKEQALFKRLLAEHGYLNTL